MASPREHSLPPGRGRPLFAALGYAVRAVKTLPPVAREWILDRAVGGVSSNLPPFADVLCIVNAAKGVPNGRRWQDRLVADRPDLAGVRTREITGQASDDSAGRVGARLYLPPIGHEAASAALVWVHGGAFVLGGLDQEEAHWPAIELAASGIPVLSVDYRLCFGGTHFPKPHNDVLAAWRWAVAHADQLGVTPEQLHLGGGSAGGCLVASVALRLRDEEGPMPASLYLAYPVLGSELPPASAEASAALSGGNGIPDEWVREMFANWAGPADPRSPYVSPGLAELTGLPPTYVLTCGRDTLRRASEPFAQRLADEGVDVWHEVFDESRHAPLDRPGTEDGKRAIHRLRTWLRDGSDGSRGTAGADDGG